MRTLVNVKDILEDANRVEQCPHCSPEQPLMIVQSTIAISPKGKPDVVISKVGLCPTHGPINIERRVKSVRMCGRDAEVIPPSH